MSTTFNNSTYLPIMGANLTQSTSFNEGENIVFTLPFEFDNYSNYSLPVTFTFTVRGTVPDSLSLGSTSGVVPIVKNGQVFTVSSVYTGEFNSTHNNWSGLTETLAGLYFFYDGGDEATGFTCDVILSNGITTATGVLTVTGGTTEVDAVNINQTNTIDEDYQNWQFGVEGAGWPAIVDQAGANSGKIYQVTYAPQSGGDEQYTFKTSNSGSGGTPVVSSTVVFTGDQDTVNANMQTLLLDMSPDYAAPFNITYTQEVIGGAAGVPYVQETGLFQFTVNEFADSINTDQDNTINENQFNWSFETDGAGSPAIADQVPTDSGRIYKVTFSPQTGNDTQYRLNTTEGGANGSTAMYSSTVWFQGTQLEVNSRIAAMVLDMGPDWTTPFNIVYTQEYISGAAGPAHVNATGLLQFSSITPNPDNNVNTTSIIYNEDEAGVTFDLATIGDERGVQGDLDYTATLTLSNPNAGLIEGWTDAGGGVFTLTDSYANIQPALHAVVFEPGADFNSNFSMDFALTRPQASNPTWSGTVTLLSATIDAAVDNIDADNGMTINQVPYNWGQNTDTNLYNLAIITDSRQDQQPGLDLEYRFTLVLDLPADNDNGELKTFGLLGGTSGWDSATSTLIVQGSKVQVQSHISTLEWWSRGPLDAFTMTASLYRGPASNVTEKLLVSYPAGIEMEIGTVVPSPINVNVTHLYDEDVGTEFNDINKTTDAINYNQTNTINEDIYGWEFGGDGQGWPQINDQVAGRTYRVTFAPVSVGNATYKLNAPNAGDGTTAAYSSTVVFTGDQATVNANIQTMILNMGPDWKSQYAISYTQEVTLDPTPDAPATPYTQITGSFVFTVAANLADTTPASLTYSEDGSISTTIATINDTRGDYPEFGVTYSASITASSTAAGTLTTAGWTSAGGGVYTANNKSKQELVPLLDITWVMAADYASNFNFTVNLTRTQQYNSPTWSGVQTLISNKVIPVTLVGGNTPEFNISTTQDYTVDTLATWNIGSIVDTATGKNYTVTLTLSDAAAGSISGWTAVGGGIYTYSGTKSVVNAQLGAVAFNPAAGFGDNFTMSYQQQQTTDGINQGSTTIAVETPINSVLITETSAGYCEYPTGGSCSATSEFIANAQGGAGVISYLWELVSAPSTITISGSNTALTCVVVSDASSSNITFNLKCTVTDSTGSETTTQTFTQTKTLEPFSVDTLQTYYANTIAEWDLAEITDAATSKNYTVTLTLSDVLAGEVQGWNSAGSGVFTFTGTKAQLNSALANVSFLPTNDYTKNFSIAYQQQQTTDNIDQGSINIAVNYIMLWEYIEDLGVLTASSTSSSGYGFKTITSNSDAISAGCADGYIFTTADNGINWEISTKGFNGGYYAAVAGLSVTSGNNLIVVGRKYSADPQAANTTAALSVDNGITWTGLPTALSAPDGAWCSKIVAGNGTVLAGFTGGQISRSTDNGETWASSQVISDTRTVSLIATDGNGVWIVGYPDEFKRSSDDGATWNAISIPLTQPNGLYTNGQGVWIAPGTNGYIARSLDNGVTWDDDIKIATNNWGVVGITPDGSWILCAGSGLCIRLIDDGPGWEQLPYCLGNTDISSGNFYNFTTGDTAIIAWAQRAASISFDNGLNWTQLPLSLNTGTTESLAGLTSQGTVWTAVAGFKVSISVDNGVTWTMVPVPYTEVVHNFVALAENTSGNGTLIALTNYRNTLTNTYYYAAVRSIDAGATWTALPQGLNSGATTDKLSSIASNGDVWVTVAENGYASHSTDNGETWAPLTKGLNSGSVVADFRTVASNGTGTWVAVARDGYASRSTDNGVTWAPLYRGLNSGSFLDFRSVSANGDTWVVVEGYGYASRSTDNGASWTALPRGLNSGTAAAQFYSIAANGDTWIAVTHAGWASRSTDNGETWVALPQGLNSGQVNSEFISIANDGNSTWYTAGAYSELAAAMSTDDGATWFRPEYTTYYNTLVNSVIYNTVTSEWLTAGSAINGVGANILKAKGGTE